MSPHHHPIAHAKDPVQRDHFIDGARVPGRSGAYGPVYDPAQGHVIAHVPFANKAEVDAVVSSAAAAFEQWRAVPPSMRARILFQFRQAIEDHKDELATLISLEHGKSLVEAHGSLSRGCDVLDFACGMPAHLKGEYSENVGRQVDSYSIRQPLGVCVGITPFNFPGMIPLWTAPIAIACGNTFILKPSERAPSCGLRLAELAHEAGLPQGVFSVIQGEKEAVNALLHHPTVQAVSFVGQTATAEYVQQTAIQQGKRVQAFGGAKNHMLIMPDADLEQVVDALLGAAYGSAGQRCMAISVAVVVGDDVADDIITRLAPKVKNLKIGPYTDPAAEMGPLITREQLEKVRAYVDSGVQEGASLVVDGRSLFSASTGGFYLGGCLFDHVTPSMTIYQEEIFGPVLCVVRVKTYEEGLMLVDAHPYGNGVAIFTRDGDCARDFAQRVQVGMVGINVPIPVPVGYHSFGGWKRSIFADVGMHGQEGIRFYTKLKTVTARWPSGIRSGVEFSLPTVS